jgi:hypothetical protein
MHELDIHEEQSWNQPRPKWGKRLLIAGLGIVLLCLAVPLVYFIVSTDQELQQAIAEANGLDPGWQIPELEQKRAVIPDDQNSGLVLMAAKNAVGDPSSFPGKAALPPNWPFWDHPQASEKGTRSEEEVQKLQESFADLEPCVQLDERQTRALREEMRRAEKVLTAVRRVGDLPRGRYPIAYSRDFISTLLPFTQEARMYGTLFDYDALLRAQVGDVDGALVSCRGILNCGRSIGDEPTLISMLVRIALNSLATKKVERTLTQGEPSEAALSRMQREFEAEAREPLLLIGVRGERGMTDGAMQALQSGDLDPRFFFGLTGGSSQPGFAELLRIPGMAKNTRAALLKYNNRFVEIAKLPVEQQGQLVKELQASEQDLPTLACSMAAATGKVVTAFHRDRAHLRCAVVMLAAERYRRVKGRWPNALTDLVPDFLATAPLDPFDGNPLRYRLTDQGVVIYSVGPDEKDNGGRFDKDARRSDRDLALRLWDVRKRRELPKPPKPPDGEPDHE